MPTIDVDSLSRLPVRPGDILLVTLPAGTDEPTLTAVGVVSPTQVFIQRGDSVVT